MARLLDHAVEEKIDDQDTYQEQEHVTCSSDHPFKNSKAYQIIRNIDRWSFELFEKLVVSISLLSLVTIVFSLIVLRYVFGIAPDWSDELPRYLMVWLTFIGMSYCVRMGEHIAIDFILQKLKGVPEKIFYLGILLVAFIFSIVLIYFGYSLYEKIVMTGQKSVSLEISMSYVYVSIPIGAFLMAKNFLHLIVLNIFSRNVVLSLKEGDSK